MNKYDVIIIGGGPAGMSAALWSADLGLRAILIEREPALGGQLVHIFNPIENYLGLSTANGEELRARFAGSVKNRDFKLKIRCEVKSVDLPNRTITSDDGSVFEASAIIIATGVRRRTLGVAGENEFFGKGILTSGAKEGGKVKGKKVVVIGGGDAAFENALILSEQASVVTLIHRGDEFNARGSFIDAVREKTNVEIVTGKIVRSLIGNDSLKIIEVTDRSHSAVDEIATDFALIRIGVEPNSELFVNQVESDDGGYLLIDAHCETSCKNCYAVGDIASPNSPTIANAVGNAASAVMHFSKKK